MNENLFYYVRYIGEPTRYIIVNPSYSSDGVRARFLYADVNKFIDSIGLIPANELFSLYLISDKRITDKLEKML